MKEKPLVKSGFLACSSEKQRNTTKNGEIVRKTMKIQSRIG